MGTRKDLTMNEKTLGQINFEVYSDEIGKTKVWSDLLPDQRKAFEIIAQAVIEAHESRKRQPLPMPPKQES